VVGRDVAQFADNRHAGRIEHVVQPAMTRHRLVNTRLDCSIPPHIDATNFNTAASLGDGRSQSVGGCPVDIGDHHDGTAIGERLT